MLSKEKLEQLLAILGDLTGEQKAIVIEALQKQIPDKDLPDVICASFVVLSVDYSNYHQFSLP